MNMNTPRPLLSKAVSSKDPFVIAEIGVNHDGNSSLALDLVESAAKAGADAVKFQWFDSSELLSSSAKLVSYQCESGESDPHEMLNRLQLSTDDMRLVIDSAHRRGLRAMVTVFTPRLVGPALTLPWDIAKVASPDLVNRPLLEALRTSGLPILMSTGGSSLEEVRQALSWIGSEDLGLLHCVSSYPTNMEDAGLAVIRTLADATGVPVGYSDHTSLIETGAFAVSAGATILEKHLTWNTSARGPDHAASMDPDGFAAYVACARKARIMLGKAQKSMQPSEVEVISASRQSVSVIDEVPSGATLQVENLTTMRPGGGIPPAQLNGLVGRRVIRRIPPRSLISPQDLECESAP